MSEMVERVARAIQATRGPLQNWDRVPQEVRALWLADARAAIAALRGPTEAMIRAALAANAWQADGSARGMDNIRKKYRERWNAMLDAALKD